MFHLQQVLSTGLLSELAESTAEGLARRDCFYDQFHYINRRFVAKHFEELAGLVVESVSHLRPGITVSDLTYVNDFVAPINLVNGQIHTELKDNKYGWHNDGIDKMLRPCYNLWIPLWRRSALTQLDDQSLFDVLTPTSCPPLYDAAGNLRCAFIWNTRPLGPHDRDIVSKLLGVPLTHLDDYVYCATSWGTEKILNSEFNTVSVVRPQLGDCYIFDSSNLHASGPSRFERVGVSIKFLVNNPKLGFEVLPHFMAPLGWGGMFVCCYDQFRNFSAYQDLLPMYISREQPMFEQNADKLESVREVLLQARDELRSDRAQ
jgi:hypothetical protein